MCLGKARPKCTFPKQTSMASESVSSVVEMFDTKGSFNSPRPKLPLHSCGGTAAGVLLQITVCSRIPSRHNITLLC